MNNILLIGATGFLGALIHKHYEYSGNRVVTLGRNPASDIVADFNDMDSIANCDLSEFNIDTVILCAAVNETQISQSLSETYKINVALTRVVVELAKRANISNMIYVSTFHVYGRSYGHLDEISDCHPLNDYGLTHLLSEKIIVNQCSQNNMQYLIVRPTNIYGIPADLTNFDRWTLVPFEFVREAVKRQRIVIKSSGKQLRNFVSVDDVIASFDVLGKHPVVNCYGSDTLSIFDFANVVAKHVQRLLGKQVVVSRIEDSKPNAPAQLEITNQYDDFVPTPDALDNYIDRMITEVANYE